MIHHLLRIQTTGASGSPWRGQRGRLAGVVGHRTRLTHAITLLPAATRCLSAAAAAGLVRAEVLSALINTAVIVVLAGYLVYEGIRRIMCTCTCRVDPQLVDLTHDSPVTT